MTVQVSQLRAHLGQALDQLYPSEVTDQRHVQCATIFRDASEASSACFGEIPVLIGGLDPDAVAASVEALSIRRAAGLLVAAECLDARVRSRLLQEAARHQLVVGILRAGVDVSDIVNTLNRAVARVRANPTVVSLHATDSLQGLAETLGRLIGNSVTIESPRHKLLAFSAITGTVDRVREETILRRIGKTDALNWVVREGYIDRILASDEPVRVPANPDLAFTGRLARRVASEGEPLGIVWVTDTERPLAERDEEIIGEAADAAAALLVRQREAMQREAELRTEILEDIVHGRITNPESIRAVARSIGWNIGRLRQALVVVIDDIEAVRLRHTGQGGRQLQRARERLTELVRLETLTIDPEAVVGPRSTGTIVLFSGDESDDAVRKANALRLATRIAKRFHEQIPDLTVTVGVGQHMQSFEQLAETVGQAELAAHLGVTLWGGNRAVHYSDLGIHRALFTLQQHEEMISPALQRIIEYDEKHNSDFLATLDAYLACMGRLRVAAEKLHIHRNTLEYRMRRIEELAGVQLDDRDNRLALELGIRLLDLKKTTRGPAAPTVNSLPG